MSIEARMVLPEDVTEGLVTRQIANDVISSLLGGVSDLTHERQWSGQGVGGTRRRNDARWRFARLCRRVRGVDLKVASGATDGPGGFQG